MTDLIIIGAGPAGLSAAIYGARAGKRVLVLEAMMPGGQIVNTPEVENYPGIQSISGFDFANALYEQASLLGAEIIFESAAAIEDLGDVKKVITESGSYEGKAVILATGAKNRKLGLEKEEKLTGSGISYCATCDGSFYRGKVTAVVGGGNTALEDAFYLSNLCEKVYLIHRRDSFRADLRSVEKLKEKKNIEVIMESRVTELFGEEKLQAAAVEHIPSGEKKKLEIDGLFVAVGQEPVNQAFQGLVQLDAGGYICAGEDCLTGTPGIFTAGDCRSKKVRQLTTAAADGAVAALAACEYIG